HRQSSSGLVDAAPGSAQRFALCCALAYGAVASAWVLLSALGVGWLTDDGRLLLRLYQAKGLLLVAMTALLVYAAALWAARRLRGHEALLRRHAMQLSGIVDTAMDAIITVDAAQTIVVFNRAAAEVFRLPCEQAIGQPLARFVPPRLHAAHQAHVQRFSSSGKTSRRMGQLHTLVGLRADGQEFPMEASVSRLGEGAAVLMTVVLRDATERIDAQTAHEARLAAEAASQAKTQFLARMSHELRTPLNAILGFSQLLRRPDEALSADHARQVAQIEQAGWHLLALVDDVLNVSHIEACRLQIDCRAVPLHPLLDAAWLLTEVQARRHGVVMDAAFRGTAASTATTAAWCDPLRLRQVLLNLLSNAVKYNRPGGWVRLALSTDQARVRLSVVDSGLGMTPDQLAHLYEPFNRLGRERSGVEGSGIGLALSRQLVLLMNGSLDITSTPGQGTRVDVELPLARADQGDGLPPRAAAYAATPPSP
ncbi:MAG: PAS domain-containing sensor histidine kinase, partial [Burkholderiales bacterium]|nr:PAS domain-containing sensor histidine kinase [Burkholderiales bacterium]